MKTIAQIEPFAKISIDIIIFFGLILNLVTFMVFSRKPLVTNSIGTYCRLLALADSFILYQLIFDLLTYSLDRPFEATSDAACKVFFYLSTSLSSVSGWIIAMLGLDKMLVVLMTKKLAIVKSKWFPGTIVLVIYLVNLVQFVCVPIVLELKNVTIRNTTYLICDGPDENSLAVVYLYLIHSNLVPFVIMMTTALITSVGLFRSAQHSLNSATSQSSRRRRKRDIRFAFSSISLSILFMGFQVPVVFGFLLNFTLDSLFDYLLCLFFFNFATRFFGHLMFNCIFRRIFLKMIRCQSKTNGKSLSIDESSMK